MGADSDELALERHRDYLIALARFQVNARPWLASKLDASDLVQTVLLRAHAARGEFRGRTTAECVAWLKQILTRTLANELRDLTRAKRDVGAERPAADLEADLGASSRRIDAWLAADQSSPSQRACGQERAVALAAAVEALPPDQRAVVLLKHCEGLTLGETAGRVGRTPAAVAGLLRRGLERLRQLLDEDHRP